MARTLTTREKRLVRGGAIAVVVYLALFYGLKGWRYLEEKRIEYTQLSVVGERIKYEILQEKSKARRLEKLRETLTIDLASLREETVVGETRNAIQAAARSCGIGIGSSREVPGGGGGKELATIQLEGGGNAVGLMKFLHTMRTIGYPVVLDRLSIQAAGKPGQVRFSVAAVILNFTPWQAQEASDA